MVVINFVISDLYGMTHSGFSSMPWNMHIYPTVFALFRVWPIPSLILGITSFIISFTIAEMINCNWSNIIFT